MLADDGTPILMDFGSTIKARIHVENRNQALTQQAYWRSISVGNSGLTCFPSRTLPQNRAVCLIEHLSCST